MRRICAAQGCCPSDAGRAWWGAARLWSRSPASSLWTHAHSKPASSGLQAEQPHFEGSTAVCGVWLGLCQAQAVPPWHCTAPGMETQLLLLLPLPVGLPRPSALSRRAVTRATSSSEDAIFGERQLQNCLFPNWRAPSAFKVSRTSLKLCVSFQFVCFLSLELCSSRVVWFSILPAWLSIL